MEQPQINLRHLVAMAAVAETHSASLAARRINLTQPAVTQAVAKLEAQLGVALFERTSSGMIPTEAATRLKPRVDVVLRLIGNPRVTTVQARALVAVARAGSFVAAAKAAGVAQPSLHRSVADLTLTMGFRLVERRGKGILLTRQGAELARRLRLAFGELRQGLDDLADLRDGSGGRILVGAMPLCRARLLPDAILAFQAEAKASLSVHEGSHAELVGPLRDGEIDMMIGALRDPADYLDLKQQPLFEDRPHIMARAGHPLSGGWDADALRRYPWLLPPEGAPLRRLWRRMFDTLGGALPETPVECGSVITIRQLLLGGDFLTLLSVDQVAFELAAGVLIDLGPAPGEVVRTIGVTTRGDWRPTALQSLFMAILEERSQALNS